MESILFWAPAIYILLSTIYIIYLHKKISNMTIELDVFDIKVDELKKTADDYKQQLDTLKEETEKSYDNLYDITSETLKKISDNRDEIYNAYIKSEDELYALQEKIIQSFILMRSIDYKFQFHIGAIKVRAKTRFLGVFWQFFYPFLSSMPDNAKNRGVRRFFLYINESVGFFSIPNTSLFEYFMLSNV